MLRLAAALLAIALPATARAELVFTMTQQGSDVVLSGQGSLNLSGLIPLGASAHDGGRTHPAGALFGVGPAGPADYYTPVTFVVIRGVPYPGYFGPASFGPGGQAVATAETGDRFLFARLGRSGLNPYGELAVPQGYVSGSRLAGSSLFAGQTLNSFGATPGTYQWSYATDSITLVVAVPEPGAVGLGLSAGLTALAGWRTRRRWAGLADPVS